MTSEDEGDTIMGEQYMKIDDRVKEGEPLYDTWHKEGSEEEDSEDEDE